MNYRTLVFIVTLLLSRLALAQEFVVNANHETGVYNVGEEIEWTVAWTGGDAPKSAAYTIKRGEMTPVDSGTISFDSNGKSEISSKLDEPGTLLLEVTTTLAGGKTIRGLGGAVAAPDQIKTSADRPADFDAFWASKVKELQSVPPEPKLESAPSEKPNVDYWKITLNNIRGSHIDGQIAKPASGGKHPALLIVQWAGVYPLQKSWVTDRAADGWLVLNIEAHDLPIDEPADFYKKQFDGPLKDYWSIGNDDRDTSYFLRMYLSCYRAADYLTTRDDWDGKTLVVMGGSQGGQQALMTAGFYPKITAALAIVPAGCDMLGPDIGRIGGWPQWYTRTDGKDAKKVHEASRYFDVANFTPNIHCPVLVGLGLIDETCPAAGILAAVNEVKSPKQIVILPKADHQGVHDSHAAYVKQCYEVWLPALEHSGRAPIEKVNAR